MAASSETCFLEGVEVANLTHEALDDIFLNRRADATEKLNKAEILADNSECMSGPLKDRVRDVTRALRMEIATGRI
jgi:hypothetical protein